MPFPDDRGPLVQQYLSAFKQRLHELGWIETRNIRLDIRFTDQDADRIRTGAEELIALSPNVIVVWANPGCCDTYRTITVAAFGVLVLAPESVVHPSFQMSFAATLALVAGYQHGLPWMIREGKTQLDARIALWGGRKVVSLAIASLPAGTATMPFVAYHFHRVSPYGVIANLAAMPIVSAWVMPR